MLLTIDLATIPKDITINQYMGLVKIHMYINNEPFDYLTKEYLTILEYKDYISVIKDGNGKLISFNLTEKATKLLANSLRLNDKFSINQVDTSTSKEIVDKLAIEIREIFPSGKKDGKWYYKSTKPIIIDKLKRFSSKYKISLSKNYDKIIEATKRYVNSFEHNQNGMSIIKYFIEKQQSGSILLEYMEQLDEEDPDELKNTTNYI